MAVQALTLLDKGSRAFLRAIGARGRRVGIAGGWVHAFEIRGRGEGTYVLLHGMGASATAYVAVARRLRRAAARIVLVDLPGHGESSLPSDGLDALSLAGGLREALDRLIDPADPAVVLGTSLGGAAALAYALERPERVRALVLASPAGAPLSESASPRSGRASICARGPMRGASSASCSTLPRGTRSSSSAA
jgi:pimeloyl-ACP methyl ester carboxylesterase